jgi:thiol:disulfide interchange protein
MKPAYKMFPKLVKSEMDQVINDPTKHVIVAYTTPWCHYCKEVETMYKKVNKHLYKHVKDFIFARVDYMRNDLDLNITNFPTIMIYPKDNKKNPIKYDMI